MKARGVAASVVSAGLALLACSEPAPPRDAPRSVRLVSLFASARIEHAGPVPTPPPRTELRFAQPAPAFEAGPGIAKLAARDATLSGTTTGRDGALRVLLPAASAPGDFVHAVELRMRVSAGGNVALDLRGPDNSPTAEAFAPPTILWPIAGPIVAGAAMRTYTLEPQFPIPSERVREIYLAPSDVAGAQFDIESVRVIFEKERLASVPSGPGWHGLSEVYRETLVARAPEALRFALDTPPAAWLDLAIGTIEDEALRFRVLVRDGGKETTLLERTLTTKQRWEPLRVDLGRFSGNAIQLVLALDAEKPGAIGFWGAPVVRSALPRAPLQGVIVILADTLRSDHLDAYGYARETAPVLRRLAAEGVLFRDAVAQASWTKVSMTSNHTSLYPSSHGVRNFADRLPDEAHTLAEAFRAAGFATFSSTANFFTGKLTHLEQGFEELHESAALASGESSKSAREQLDAVLPWLEAHREVPFFVYLHVTDPHSPYRPAAPYDTLFANAADGAQHGLQQRELRKFITNPLMKAFGMPLASELAASGIDREKYLAVDRAWYDGSIRAMDAEVGRLIERVRELGLAEQTLVVFTADHGEEFLEHGASFHGRTNYGEVTRVPLVFWGPGRVAGGRVIEDAVEGIDVMPTLLELAAVPAQGAMQGQSLASLFAVGDAKRASRWSERPAISEHRLDQSGLPWTDREGTSIQAGGWKLIENSAPGADIPAVELYDARSDRLDAHDLAAAHPDIVARLHAQLTAWRSEVAKLRLKPPSPTEAPLSPEEIERLKSLGYLQ
ncbi:MAG TPA: sulfatase [Myxococcota bacterium]|jgi:arylsulfatase A-like enzyme